MYNFRVMNASAKTAVVLSTLFISFGFSTPALAVTTISDDIEGDTTWTLSESPYLITESINFSAIIPGATLTIEPGVVVELEPNTTFNIFGDLRAAGTQNQNIIFKSTETNGNWNLNVHNSLNSELGYISLESIQGTLALHNSVVSVTQMTSNSKLTFYSGVTTNIQNLNLVDNQLYVDGGTTIIDQLNINGSGSNFYGTTVTLNNINISQTNNLPAIVITDGVANLENVIINDASHGIIANNVDNLSVYNANISNISNDGIIFGGGVANLNEVTIENAYYGAGLQGNVIGLTNFHVRDTQSSSVQTNANETTVIDSSFSNGPNTGLTINGGIANLQNVTIKNFANAPAFLPNVENLQGERLVITNNLFGIYNYGSSTIRRSKIVDNTYAGAVNDGYHLDARENYWGHIEGPTLDSMNPDSIKLGDGIMGDILYEPWLTEYCEVNCYSNIMFLPGIMGSRLYEGGEQLWEADEDKVSRLHLDENGESISNKIVTNDLVDTFDGPTLLNKNIYESFLGDLERIKADGVINDYVAVPYDWRLSLSQILASGVEDGEGNISYLQDTTDPYIEKTLRELASSSKSGKVTIVAHSNGGLLTKALINSLGSDATSLIDKVILVAVPQLGTPQAIGALLHGYDSGIPLVLSDEAARSFAKNAPMSYQLLPFSDYYNGDAHTVSTPYVTFEDGSATEIFIDKYGYAITPNELKDFLIGTEGRDEPLYNDTYNLAVANSTLFDNATSIQEDVNSSWIPPEGIKVHQVAGIGEYTPVSIHYKTIQKCKNRVVVCIGGYEDVISYDVNEVINGDGTVVIPSALAMDDSDEVKNWWVNLNLNNTENLRFGPFRVKHADILEIDEVRSLIFGNLITEVNPELPRYISSTMPNINEGDRLEFTLHSPLSLSARTDDGRIVSEAEITIPGAHYARYGEIQKISIPSEIEFTVVLNGEAEGSFTLEGVEIKDEEAVETVSFSAIPSSTSTIAEIKFRGNSLEDSGSLLVDYNGDGTVETTYTPMLGDIVISPDPVLTVDDIQTGGMISSGVRPISKVAGASTEVINYYELLVQLQLIIKQLGQLRSESVITEIQYESIKNKIQIILFLINGNLINSYKQL